MQSLFAYAPESISNTQKIADMCDFEYKFGDILLPVFQVPDNKTPYEYMRMLCENGIKGKYGGETEEIKERVNYELEMINKMGYVEYYLIVWDFIRFAKEKGIMVGPGRGSGGRV